MIVLALRVLPAARPARQREFDLPGMVVLAVMLGALTFGIDQLDTAHFAVSLTSLNVWPFLLLAVVLFPAFLAIESRSTNPVLRLSLFESRQVSLVSLVAVGAGLGEASVVFVPSLLVAVYGVTSAAASFMLLPAVLAMAVGAPTGGWMLDRIGSRVVLLAAALLVTTGMFVIAFVGTGLWLFYLSALLVGLGLGALLGAPLRYVMLNETPASERASAQGILTLNTSVGQLLGGALIGAVAASFGGGTNGYVTAFVAVGLVMLLMTATTVGLKGRAEELAAARRNQAADPQRA